jgi:dihydroorotate dehydrogenase
VVCLRRVYEKASYITVNISSPNTKNLRDLQSDAALTTLMTAVRTAQLEMADKTGRYVPIAVKIAPDLSDEAAAATAQVLVTMKADAIIATNTTIARTAVAGHRYAAETGGLSGTPVRERADAVLAIVVKAVDGAVPVIGVGGINDVESAKHKLALGASLVQLYTGLIYKGPGLVADIVRAL